MVQYNNRTVRAKNTARVRTASFAWSQTSPTSLVGSAVKVIAPDGADRTTGASAGPMPRRNHSGIGRAGAWMIELAIIAP